MVISTAHSSCLVLRGDDEAESNDDSDHGSDWDEMPEEQVNDNAEAGAQNETECVEEIEGNRPKSVVDNLSNADDEEISMD